MKRRTVLFVGSMALLSFLFIGCNSSNWHPQRKVETESERKCVMQEERALLRNVPRTLSGHDQDWDDAIKAAHEAAIQTCCATRIYEYRHRFTDQGWTGAMKEVGR